MTRRLAGLLLAMLAYAIPSHAQEKPPEPDSYRMENYRTPVPATLAGARVLTTEEAETIWRAKARTSRTSTCTSTCAGTYSMLTCSR